MASLPSRSQIETRFRASPRSAQMPTSRLAVSSVGIRSHGPQVRKWLDEGIWQQILEVLNTEQIG